MKSIVLLHPFTSKAIGMDEHDLLQFHSRPHEFALKKIKDDGYKVFIDYFTSKLIPFTVKSTSIEKRFWPLSCSPKNRFKWLKETSLWHSYYYNYKMPDMTIINVSGNGSNYAFKLAKKIKKKRKAYIAMIGGAHVDLNPSTLKYYKNAHSVIVHTDNQREQLKSEAAFSDVNINVVPLGVDIEIFKPKEKAPTSDIELLYVGRITRLKQVELAITAVNKLAESYISGNVNLNIIGPVDDYKYLNELKQLISSSNSQHNIKFIGSKSTEELVPYYQSATLLLLPSKQESFGMVIVEAMACGTPAIALKTALGPSDIISHLDDGILSEQENFAEDLMAAIRQSSAIGEMAIKARQKIIEQYSLDATYRELKTAIRKALD